MSSNDKIKWQLTSAITWHVKAHRGYTADITYLAGTGYTVVSDPAGLSSTHATLRLAKNAFRKFLFTK